MNPLDLEKVYGYVNPNQIGFNKSRIKFLGDLRLENLLTLNPYLFKVKNHIVASKMISELLDASLISFEEKQLGNFLLGLAFVVAEMTCKGYKSSVPGVDLEFLNNGVHYIVSVKTEPVWGDNVQEDKLEQDLRNASIKVMEAREGVKVQSVLGICYGKSKTSYLRGYMKVVGQNFWYLISENPNLYTDIIEIVDYWAHGNNNSFLEEKSRAENRLTGQFLNEFFNEDGSINWVKLVEFNSGNFDLDKFLP
jgi:hypothetical protein